MVSNHDAVNMLVKAG